MTIRLSRAALAVQRNIHVNTDDVAVGVIAGAAATAQWWAPWFEWLNGAAQGLILAGTVIFVLYRAMNEIKKFYAPKDDSE